MSSSLSLFCSKLASFFKCKKRSSPVLVQIRAIIPSKSVKPSTCTPTMAQTESSVSYISAGEAQQTENASWETLPRRGGKASSKCLMASLHTRTTTKSEEGQGKQVHSSDLLSEEERSVFLLIPFFRTISTHSLR